MTVTENGTQDPRGASSAENLNLDVAERIAQREKCPNQLALVARVRELESRIRELDRKSTRLNSSHIPLSRMPSSA